MGVSRVEKNGWKVDSMEVEYSGGGVLIFSYLILIHQLDNFGGLRTAKLNRGSLIQVSSLAAAMIAARLYLTNSAKRKRRKPPRSATDGVLGRLQSNSTSMVDSKYGLTSMSFSFFIYFYFFKEILSNS